MVDSLYSAITNIEQSQSQKEATANAGFDRISAMIAATLAGGNAVVTAGNFVPTFANPTPEWQANVRFVVSGTPGVQREMQTPVGAAFCKLFIVQNDSDSALLVQVDSPAAGTTVLIATTDKAILYSDGTNITQEGSAGGAGDFLSLTDTPGSYAGQALRALQVNVGETALEFADFPTGGAGASTADLPGFIGALVKTDANFLGSTTGGVPLPSTIGWDSEVYDTRHDPQDGGPSQRFWLGVNKTFVDGDVTVGSDTVTETAHGFATGEGPLRLTTTGTLPAGLATATDYWIIVVDADTIAFATDRANALADIRVDITAAAGGGTHTIETETRLVIPAGVSRVRLKCSAEIDNTESAFDIQKNGATFSGYSRVDLLNSTGLDFAFVTSPVLQVTEGDVFEAGENVIAAVNILSANSATWFSIEVVELSSAPQSIPVFIETPRHHGALVKIDSDQAASTTGGQPLPNFTSWDSAVFDTSFQPDDAGPPQRFWLGVNQTFVDANVTTGTDVVAITAHGFVTGEGPLQLTSSGTLPAGLALATNYWVERVDANTIAFATSRANAIAGTRVDITAAAGGGTHTLNTETRFVVPDNVTKVRLKTSVDLDGETAIDIQKNGSSFSGYTRLDTSNSAGVDGTAVASPVLEVVAGDYFQSGNNVISAANMLTGDGGTWFSIEVVETSLNPIDLQSAGPNLAVNGGFAVAQQGTSFTAVTTPTNGDGVMQLDQHRILSDGADTVDLDQVSGLSAPVGHAFAARLTVQTANRKFGLFHIMESQEALKLIGGRASVAIKIRTTTGAQVNNARVGIVSWSSTVDAPTADPISTWNLVGVDPTLAANWTFENVPVNLAVPVDSYGEFVVEDVAIDTASAANVGILIWVDDTDAAIGDEFFVADLRVVTGPRVGEMVAEPFIAVLSRCQRFISKSFDHATVPAANAGSNGTVAYRVSNGGGVLNGGAHVKFPVTMLKVPAITFFNPLAAGAAWRSIADVGDSGAASSDLIGEEGFHATNAQVVTDVDGELVAVHYRALVANFS